MKLSTRIISSLSIASLAVGTAAPALAYIVDDALMPASEERVDTSGAIPTFSPFNQDPGSGFRINRRITSRSIRGDREQNRVTRVGKIRVHGGERDEATEDSSGRIMLPVRGEWRQPSLRNVNRHLLGRERLQGAYGNTRAYEQGDIRRRPSGAAYIRYRFPSRLAPERVRVRSTNAPEAYLPPSLVQTGSDADHPNWRRWARGRTDGSLIRDINAFNRPDYE